MSRDVVGISVYCAVCRREKAPHGRSVSALRSYCTSICKGYYTDPAAGCLWPGETSEEFGYAHCDNATVSTIDAVTSPQK